jgi:chloramphenicol-sensitive protein RarD
MTSALGPACWQESLYVYLVGTHVMIQPQTVDSSKYTVAPTVLCQPLNSSETSADRDARNGVIAAACSFFIWGLLPLYLKPLHSIPALQIAAWRYVMACLTLVGWMSWRGGMAAVWQALTNPRLLSRLTLTASLLAINWTLYAWGIAHGQILMSSLGYFINPLVNVLLGVLVLSERLNRVQWIAVALATAAVLALTLYTGQLPWLALALAATFSLYGLLRKTAPVAPLPGLAVETLLVAPLALGYLLVVQRLSEVASYSPLMLVLLGLSGVATVVPLTLFNYGAQRINYVTVGMLQYIGPTLQFLIGVFIYRESLSPARLLCFALIWLALAIYASEGLWRGRGA